MPDFRVDTYKIAVTISRVSAYEGDAVETRRHRGIELWGLPLAPGIQNTAGFSFSSQFDGWVGSPQAGRIMRYDTGVHVLGWFPLAEFDDYYDLLRSERPVHVYYEYGSGRGFATDTTDGALRRVGLSTTTGELVGEGPSDSSITITGTRPSVRVEPL